MTKADPQVEPQASIQPDDDSISIPLSTPIPVFAEMVTTLKMRKPTGADLLRVGNPVEFDPVSDPPRISHNMSRVQQMVSRLAGVPSGSIERMDTVDLVACAWALTHFFIPRPGQT